MKVAIVQETIDLSRGGAETSTVEMAQALAGFGHEVTLVARAADTEGHSLDSVQLHAVHAGGTRVARAISFVRAAGEYCLRGQFDIIHAVTPCLSADIYQPRGGTYVETVRRNIALESSLLRRVIKRIDHRLNLRQRFLALVERELLSGDRRPYVASLSEYVRRQVIEQYAMPEAQVRVVFNAVSTVPLSDADTQAARQRLRENIGVAPDRPVVLFAAHNFKLKGLRELLPAFSRIGAYADAPGERPMLVVAGRGSSSTYARLGRRLGIAEDVSFIGATNESVAWFAAADVLAHPTWYDPCSRVVLEALCCGLPVVTTRLNGAAEVMRPDVHGVVVDSPRDIAALASALARCLRPEIGSACRAAAVDFRREYSMARHARELTELYEEVVAQRGRARSALLDRL
ncbi:MAG: glycosyltransferase family 4 protein [Phycisphaerae bacterium]|nr:glycosyltransferase family 4 protein [Phycisphaerae bacterium]